MATPSRQSVLNTAWAKGLLKYKLYKYQHVLYDTLWGAINNPKCLKYALNCSRRWGKSTVCSLIAIEFALRKPNAQIRFAAPTGKALKKITHPIFKMLLEDCPKEHRPEYKVQEQVWVFPNGSEIHMAGTDGGNSESLRGTASDLNLIDEAGFCDELDYVLRSILLPQTLTTGGKTLLASTPPKSPSHDYYNIYQECEASGFSSTYTILDNPTIDKDTLDLYAKESGGYSSTTFKREYMCLFIVSEEQALIPEWNDAFIQAVKPDEYNKYYLRYVGMDLGVKDFTAALFGYYDFKKAALIIEDEITMDGPSLTTVKLKDAILEKERNTFGDIKPFRRISDNNNLMLIQDLGHLHNLHFAPTSKESLDAMLNEVRMMVANGQIIVHPRCEKLIGCLKYGIWNNKRSEFARSSVYGHFDHLAALVYLVRNLDKHSNPVPRLHNIDPSKTFIMPDAALTNNHKALKDIFRV